jgi:protocatechuate 3,4-dioxygenase alpha subunit
MYFPGEEGNARDFALAAVEPARRGTLIAAAVEAGVLTWDIVLQGAQETVFFDC